MVSWATQRKLTYLSIFIALILILIALPTYYYYTVYRAPTCSDGRQDGTEQGVDCGGPCSLLCPAQAIAPTVEWARVFEVVAGYYNAVAYIDDPNIGYSARNVSYEFDLYDSSGEPIAIRKGTTNIIANQQLAIFEPNITTGQKIPAQVLFKFTSTPSWYKETYDFPTLTISDPVLSRETTSPLLQAQIEDQNDFVTVTNLPVIAIVYDTDGNAIAVSKTVVEQLERGVPQSLIFTWPAPFGKTVSQKEIIPLLGESSIAVQGN